MTNQTENRDSDLVLTSKDLVANDDRWTFRKVIMKTRRRYGVKGVLLLSFILAFLPILILYERPLYQPLVVAIVAYRDALIMLLAVAGTCWLLLRSGRPTLRILGVTLGVVSCGTTVLWGPIIFKHVADYTYYIGLDVVDLTKLPTTDKRYERILPLAGVHTLLRERMNVSEEPTAPDLVRIGNEYRWTAASQAPSQGSWWYLIRRFWDPVDEIIDISATSPAPNLDRRTPIKVNFEVGENKLFAANIDTCVRRAFGLRRFFTYEPGNVLYLKNDQGERVIVVSLMRWSGIIFPRPEFGGVQVIEQGKNGYLMRNSLGCGTWVPPEEIHKHAYLRGQNIQAYQVSRYVAESFRFQAGFGAPTPWGTGEGRIRIADLPDDMNEQPFTLYFKLPGQVEGGLYHYVALEPYESDSQGLAMSLFIPADGLGKVHVYRHHARGEQPIGVTSVGSKIQEVMKHYDWSKNLVAEARPLMWDLPDANGKVETRFCWLSTIVTLKATGTSKGEPLKPEQKKQFIPGSVPEMACVDAYNGIPVWLDALRPELWSETLQQKLGAKWVER